MLEKLLGDLKTYTYEVPFMGQNCETFKLKQTITPTLVRVSMKVGLES